MDIIYTVLYTHQKTKKTKTWQDGTLKVLATGTKAVLYDGKGFKLDVLHIHASDVVTGEQLESDRYYIQVEEIQKKVAAPTADTQVTSRSPQVPQHSMVKAGAGVPQVSDSHTLQNASSRNESTGMKRKRGGFVPPRLVRPHTAESETQGADNIQPGVMSAGVINYNPNARPVWTSCSLSDDSACEAVIPSGQYLAGRTSTQSSNSQGSFQSQDSCRSVGSPLYRPQACVSKSSPWRTVGSALSKTSPVLHSVPLGQSVGAEERGQSIGRQMQSKWNVETCEGTPVAACISSPSQVVDRTQEVAMSLAGSCGQPALKAPQEKRSTSQIMALLGKKNQAAVPGNASNTLSSSENSALLQPLGRYMLQTNRKALLAGSDDHEQMSDDKITRFEEAESHEVASQNTRTVPNLQDSKNDRLEVGLENMLTEASSRDSIRLQNSPNGVPQDAECTLTSSPWCTVETNIEGRKNFVDSSSGVSQNSGSNFPRDSTAATPKLSASTISLSKQDFEMDECCDDESVSSKSASVFTCADYQERQSQVLSDADFSQSNQRRGWRDGRHSQTLSDTDFNQSNCETDLPDSEDRWHCLDYGPDWNSSDSLEVKEEQKGNRSESAAVDFACHQQHKVQFKTDQNDQDLCMKSDHQNGKNISSESEIHEIHDDTAENTVEDDVDACFEMGFSPLSGISHSDGETPQEHSGEKACSGETGEKPQEHIGEKVLSRETTTSPVTVSEMQQDISWGHLTHCHTGNSAEETVDPRDKQWEGQVPQSAGCMELPLNTVRAGAQTTHPPKNCLLDEESVSMDETETGVCASQLQLAAHPKAVELELHISEVISNSEQEMDQTKMQTLENSSVSKPENVKIGQLLGTEQDQFPDTVSSDAQYSEFAASSKCNESTKMADHLKTVNDLDLTPDSFRGSQSSQQSPEAAAGLELTAQLCYGVGEREQRERDTQFSCNTSLADNKYNLHWSQNIQMETDIPAKPLKDNEVDNSAHWSQSQIDQRWMKAGVPEESFQKEDEVDAVTVSSAIPTCSLPADVLRLTPAYHALSCVSVDLCDKQHTLTTAADQATVTAERDGQHVWTVSSTSAKPELRRYGQHLWTYLSSAEPESELEENVNAKSVDICSSIQGTYSKITESFQSTDGMQGRYEKNLNYDTSTYPGQLKGCALSLDASSVYRGQIRDSSSSYHPSPPVHRLFQTVAEVLGPRELGTQATPTPHAVREASDAGLLQQHRRDFRVHSDSCWLDSLPSQDADTEHVQSMDHPVLTSQPHTGRLTKGPDKDTSTEGHSSASTNIAEAISARLTGYRMTGMVASDLVHRGQDPEPCLLPPPRFTEHMGDTEDVWRSFPDSAASGTRFYRGTMEPGSWLGGSGDWQLPASGSAWSSELHTMPAAEMLPLLKRTSSSPQHQESISFHIKPTECSDMSPKHSIIAGAGDFGCHCQHHHAAVPPPKCRPCRAGPHNSENNPHNSENKPHNSEKQNSVLGEKVCGFSAGSDLQGIVSLCQKEKHVYSDLQTSLGLCKKENYFDVESTVLSKKENRLSIPICEPAVCRVREDIDLSPVLFSQCVLSQNAAQSISHTQRSRKLRPVLTGPDESAVSKEDLAVDSEARKKVFVKGTSYDRTVSPSQHNTGVSGHIAANVVGRVTSHTDRSGSYTGADDSQPPACRPEDSVMDSHVSNMDFSDLNDSFPESAGKLQCEGERHTWNDESGEQQKTGKRQKALDTDSVFHAREQHNRQIRGQKDLDTGFDSIAASVFCPSRSLPRPTHMQKDADFSTDALSIFRSSDSQYRERQVQTDLHTGFVSVAHCVSHPSESLRRQPRTQQARQSSSAEDIHSGSTSSSPGFVITNAGLDCEEEMAEGASCAQHTNTIPSQQEYSCLNPYKKSKLSMSTHQFDTLDPYMHSQGKENQSGTNFMKIRTKRLALDPVNSVQKAFAVETNDVLAPASPTDSPPLDISPDTSVEKGSVWDTDTDIQCGAPQQAPSSTHTSPNTFSTNSHNPRLRHPTELGLSRLRMKIASSTGPSKLGPSRLRMTDASSTGSSELGSSRLQMTDASSMGSTEQAKWTESRHRNPESCAELGTGILMKGDVFSTKSPENSVNYTDYRSPLHEGSCLSQCVKKEVSAAGALTRTVGLGKFRRPGVSTVGGCLPTSQFQNSLCHEVQFCGREEVESQVTPLRQVSIPPSFTSVPAYKQVLTAALTEFINIHLFTVAKTYHCALSKVDLSAYIEGVGAQGQLTGGSNNPACKCGTASKVVQVKKEGPNKGRFFYACSAPRDKQCKFFQWVDQQSGSSSSSKGGRTVSMAHPQISDPTSIMGYFRGQGVMLYCHCHFVRRTEDHIAKKWVRPQQSDSVQKKSLFIRLPKKDSATTHAKDDLWVISQCLSFGKGETFVARSTFHGPNSHAEVAVDPVAGYSSAVWTDGSVCHAIHCGNMATELACLANIQDHVDQASLPLLPHLISCHVGSGVTGRVTTKGFKPPSISQSSGKLYIPPHLLHALAEDFINKHWLNTDQALAVRQVATMMDKDTDPPSCVLLIHGVFGAGKSYLLSVLILFLVEVFSRNDTYCPGVPFPWKLMLSSTTNVAVDRVLLGLLDLGFDDFVRVGSVRKIAKPVLPYSMHASGSDSQELKDLQEMLKSQDVTSTEKHFIRRGIEKHKLGENRKRLGAVRVVGVTCAACSFQCLDKMQFPFVVLDECSQMTEPASLLPIARFACEKLVLVGDPKQLDPTLQGSDAAHGEGLEQTLFDRLMKMGHSPVMLRTQYRCHPAISAVSNALFYSGQLMDGVTAQHRQPLVDLFPTMCFYDMSSGEESSDASGSFTNEAEAQFVALLLSVLMLNDLPPQSVGVITLYKAQARRIIDIIHQSQGNTQQEMKGVQVSTVDAFQGGERDIIILSCVRTRSVGFIDCDKRMNVALSRARHHMLIVGHQRNLQGNKRWAQVIAHCQDLAGGVVQASTAGRQLQRILDQAGEQQHSTTTTNTSGTQPSNHHHTPGKQPPNRHYTAGRKRKATTHKGDPPVPNHPSPASPGQLAGSTDLSPSQPYTLAVSHTHSEVDEIMADAGKPDSPGESSPQLKRSCVKAGRPGVQPLIIEEDEVDGSVVSEDDFLPEGLV